MGQRQGVLDLYFCIHPQSENYKSNHRRYVVKYHAFARLIFANIIMTISEIFYRAIFNSLHNIPSFFDFAAVETAPITQFVEPSLVDLQEGKMGHLVESYLVDSHLVDRS